MQGTLKTIILALVLSTSVLATGQAVAAQAPGETLASISKAEGIFRSDTSSSAIKANVKSLLGSISPELVAVALTNANVSTSLALSAMVDAGVPLLDAVGFLVASNPNNASAIVSAAMKISPADKAKIVQAAIGAGASPDDLTSATAAGSLDGGSSNVVAVGGSSVSGGTGGGGGGGVVTQSKPVSPN